MTSLAASIRHTEVAIRRLERDAKKRQRELENRAKEQEKLSALEKARLEVETYENTIDVLLSVHKEKTKDWDWASVAVSLPPVEPKRQTYNELRLRQLLLIATAPRDGLESIESAKRQDDQAYKLALEMYQAEHEEWAHTSGLARRILAGDTAAYMEAIETLGPFSELAQIGSSLQVRTHNSHFLECTLRTNGRQAIPSEHKSLTTSGKLSVKAMSRSRFNDIYQDYVCGCILRITRELFALLPINSLLISASIEPADEENNGTSERIFVSVIIHRSELTSMDFETLDPSDTIMSLKHRGDLKTSRKTGEFEAVVPFTASDRHDTIIQKKNLSAMVAAAKTLNAELGKLRVTLNPSLKYCLSSTGES